MKLMHKLTTAALSAAILAGGSLAASVPVVLFDPPTAQEARALMQREDFRAAADAWAAILEVNPDDATAWFNLGYSLHASGRLDEAIKAHKKAATFDQFKGIALYNLGCAYALQGKHDAALEALSASAHEGFDVKGYAPDDADLESLRDDARFAALLGQTEAAPAARAKPATESKRGATVSKAHGGEDIQQLFQFVAMRMQPIIEEMKPEIQRNVMELAQEVQGRVQNLLGQLQQRIHEDPELVEAMEQIHTQLSENPQFMGMMEKMKSMIQQRMGRRGGMAPAATAASPSAAPEANAIAREAQRLQSAGDYAAAASAFGALVELQPNNGSARFGYAYNLHMSGSHEEAIAAHKAAAEHEQFRGIALYNLACAYALTGRTDGAFEALRAAINAGFNVRNYLDTDSDLVSLRSDPRFAELKKSLAGG